MKKQKNRAIEANNPPVEETISRLTDSQQPLLSSSLTDLSDLNQKELRLLDETWKGIEPRRRRQIMHRLAELAEDNVNLSFDAIFKRRLKDQDAYVRTLAIEGLWENEEVSLIKPLIDLMEQDISEKVQQAAASALGRFALLAEHQKLPPDGASRLSQALLAVFDDTNKPIETRRRALEAVAPLSLPQVRHSILVAYHSGHPRLKASAIYAMGRNCHLSWLPILEKELTSADAELRYEAATACGELGEDKVVTRLIELTNDPDSDVQMAAIQALGKIGGSRARGHLKKCLKHPSEAVRQAAEQALYELEVMTEPLLPHDLYFGAPDDYR